MMLQLKTNFRINVSILVVLLYIAVILTVFLYFFRQGY